LDAICNHNFLAGNPAVEAAFLMPLLTSPLAIDVVLSVVVGFVMVVLFGYTSDQKAIGQAKDQLKAHLLAVRLYRDQIPVVMGSYGKILRGTGRYLKLAFKPLLYVIIPITLLMVEVDRYLGETPVPVNTPFLLTVHLSQAAGSENPKHQPPTDPETPIDVNVELPPEIAMTAPAVHVAAGREIVWRLKGKRAGNYEIRVLAGNENTSKSVAIGNDLPRISTIRLRNHFWERMFSSAEPAIAGNSAIESILVNYPERNIEIAGYGINWIWLFFILSMIAGFIFKELLGIKI
jgi:uncharacterized membrane protein (DUF106 family)